MATDSVSIKAQKIDGQPLKIDPISKAILDKFKAEAHAGCYELIVRKARKPKSNQQVRTIFGLMIAQTIAQANDLGIDVSYFLKYLLDDSIPKGAGLTPDFLHELMYIICPTTDADGKRTTLSKMSTEQAASLFDRFRAIVAPMGIDIDEPNPNWKQG